MGWVRKTAFERFLAIDISTVIRLSLGNEFEKLNCDVSSSKVKVLSFKEDSLVTLVELEKTVTEMVTGCLRLIKKYHICM